MKITNDVIVKQLLELWEETFERSHGIFLDNRTSIMETIDEISFDRAGTQFHNIPETIAGHVHHLLFYMDVLQEYITGKRTGKTDWNESWKVKSVTEEEWSDMKGRLKSGYGRVKEFITEIDAWSNEDYLGGSIAIISHCAFHLGIIRQLKDF